jgi:hypothetical protein
VSNEQLYLAVGLPIIANLIFNGLIAGFLWVYINKRLDLMDRRLERIEADYKEFFRILSDHDKRLFRLEGR